MAAAGSVHGQVKVLGGVLLHTGPMTLDEEIQRLVRAERQRRIGLALATAPPSSDDEQWLALSARTVEENARR